MLWIGSVSVADPAPLLSVVDLHKAYRNPRVVANDGITFDVFPGRAFGLLGPNGAGKSTLVKQIVGLLAPDSGDIRLNGVSVRPGSRQTSASVAYLPQGALSLGELKVDEAITCTARLRGLDRKRAEAETDELMEALSISILRGRPIRKISGGQKRLTHLAMTLAARLPVLILDEPTTDVDPALRAQIWDLIAGHAATGASVLLVTHDVAEAEHVLDEVAILDEGRIVAMGTPAQLKADLAHKTRIEVVLAESFQGDLSKPASDLGPETVIRGRLISAWVPAEDAVRMLEKIISGLGMGNIEDVRLVSPSLQDVYLEKRS